eukprot:1179231-Prorocentrum_minimum.AAC.2
MHTFVRLCWLATHLSVNTCAVFSIHSCPLDGVAGDHQRVWQECVRQLCEAFAAAAPPSAIPPAVLATGTEDAETGATMAAWAQSKGAAVRVQSAAFEGGLRGAAAAEHIGVGEACVEVPQELLIHTDVIRKSPAGEV